MSRDSQVAAHNKKPKVNPNIQGGNRLKSSGLNAGRGDFQQDQQGSRSASAMYRNDDQAPLKLSETEKVQLNAGAVRGLVRSLVAQLVMGLVAVLVSGLVSGWPAAASALLGGLACFIPNALFALRLLVRIVAGKPASAAGFLIGELIKLGASIALLVLGVYLAQSWLVWPALLFGLVMVLKSYVLLLMRGRST